MEIETSEEIGNSEAKSDDKVIILGFTSNVVKDTMIPEDQSSESKNSPVSENKTREKNDTIIVFESNSSLDEVYKKNKSNEVTCLKVGALSAIAMEYNSSDSEIEEITEPTPNSLVEIVNQKKPTEVPKENRTIIEVGNSHTEIVNQETTTEVLNEYRTNTEISCSSDEVDSEDDSNSSEEVEDSSNDSSSDSSEEEFRNKNAEKEKSQKSKNTSQRSKQKTKGEFDDLPPIEELHITVPEVLCDPFGEVAWIVDQMVVVHPKPGKPTLNLESILFVERGRRVLGRVFDVFGQVTDPHYCVRFNNSKHIEESNIQVGMNVYFCPNSEYTSLVFLHELAKMKASDPTGDDEPPEFSDDEEEQAYYQNLRKQQKSNKVDSGSDVPNKRKRITGPKSGSGKKSAGPKSGWQSHHPWNTKRNPQSQQSSGYDQQNSIESQQAPCNSQNWYGLAAYQQNLWPRFPPFSIPPWMMFYSSQAYNDANNFRPQMGFRPPFQPPRFLNSMPWNVRNQTHSSQNLQTENPSVGNVFPLEPPPPPPSSPPPPPAPGV